MFSNNKNSYIATFCSCLILSLLLSCGGGGGGGQQPELVEESTSFEIDSLNYDLVVSYGYAVPESMLQIGHLVENSVFEFSQQADSIFTIQCDNGGQLEINHEDLDLDSTLSASDNLTLNFADCYSEIITDNVEGSITLVINKLSATESQYTAEIEVDIYGMESSINLTSQNLNIVFKTLSDSEVLQVSNDRNVTILTAENISEQIGVFSVVKTVYQETKQYSTNFSFSVDSTVLGGEFTCDSKLPFHGYIYSLPLDYSFECSAENKIAIFNQPDDTPETYDTQVTITLVGGSSETIFINHDNYIEGSLLSPFSSDLIDYISDVIETELDMGHVSAIKVDKQNNIAYLAGMLFNGENQGKIFKLDLTDLSVLAEIELKERVHRIKLSSDNSKLFVIEDSSDQRKIVNIYDTQNLSKIISIDLSELGVSQTVSKNKVDIVSLTSSEDRWIYYYYSFPNAYALLFEGTILLDTSIIENLSNINFGSGFSNQSDSFITMEITGNLENEAIFTEFRINDNKISMYQQSSFIHASDIQGLSDSQYYQIRFEYDGHLYTDAGFLVSIAELTLNKDSEINKPALGIELGRIYDLNAVPEIKAFSSDQLSELSSLNGYEKPWSRRGYVIEDGNAGFIILASGNKVYRVGKSLLP
ncbi:MAG: hypothetical protein COB38_02860 [Gammaproteobacteria bacterium]|nr:MAG: hypothetical protein COB38_02860 [Gammaproteobacteria bacterium]